VLGADLHPPLSSTLHTTDRAISITDKNQCWTQYGPSATRIAVAWRVSNFPGSKVCA